MKNRIPSIVSCLAVIILFSINIPVIYANQAETERVGSTENIKVKMQCSADLDGYQLQKCLSSSKHENRKTGPADKRQIEKVAAHHTICEEDFMTFWATMNADNPLLTWIYPENCAENTFDETLTYETETPETNDLLPVVQQENEAAELTEGEELLPVVQQEIEAVEPTEGEELSPAVQQENESAELTEAVEPTESVELTEAEGFPPVIQQENEADDLEDLDEADTATIKAEENETEGYSFAWIRDITPAALFESDNPVYDDSHWIIAPHLQVCIKENEPPLEGMDEDTEEKIEKARAELENKVPDIPYYSNKRVEAFIRLYAVKRRDIFEKALERFPKYYKMINRILADYELPPNLAYLAVVESNLNPNARSRANAIGLWQFMSYTGKHYGLSRSWWHDDRYDPEMSTVAAAKYLKRLHQRFNGNWELALAAYNSGGGTVRRAIRRAKASGKATDYWSLRLPRETRGYVPAFYAVATIFNNLEKYGFKPMDAVLDEPEKKIVQVAGGLSLKEIASVLNINQDFLEEQNPRLRFKGLTPPSYDTFEIRIPSHVEVSPKQIKELAVLKENKQEDWKVHTVRQGETLWSISQYYQIPMSKIQAYNRLRRKNLLQIGQKLMLPVPADWSPPKRSSKTVLAKKDLEKIPGKTYVHVVKAGETLWQISQKYNVSLKKIRSWNRRVLSRKYLKIGAEIVLKLPEDKAANSI